MSEKGKTPEEIFDYNPDDHYFRPKDEIRAIQKMLRGFGQEVKRERVESLMQEHGKKKAVDLIDDALKENDRITREGAVSESEFISRTGKRIDTHRKGAIPLSLEATKLEMEHCGLLDLTLEELIEKDRELADVILSVIIFLESGRI